MGLINLTTNLKSLGFGKDRKGGGDSGQPYIKDDIPSNGDDLSDAFKYGTGGPDMFLRGGLLTPLKVADDVIRFSKFFIDTKSPRGLLFVAQQNLLSRLAVKTEASYGIGYGTGQKAGTDNIVATGPINEGIYLPTSTLLQIAGNAFGVHLNKQGIDPTGLTESSIRTYSSLFPKQEEPTPDSVKENRLYKLLQGKISTKHDDTNLYQYGGGPGSILGIGKTSIKLISREQRTGINNINFRKNFYTPSSDSNTNDFDFRRDVILNLPDLNPSSLSTPSPSINPLELNYSNFVQQSVVISNSATKNKQGGFAQINPVILTKGATARYNQLRSINDPNRISTERESLRYPQVTPIVTSSIKGIDILNKEQSRIDNKKYVKYLNELSGSYNGVAGFKDITTGTLYTGSLVDRTINGENIEADNFEPDNDIITFSLSILGGNSYYFPAYINNFSDGYSVKWNAEKFLGRGEDFYTYNGFSRDFSLSFTTYARNLYAMQRMYNNLSKITAALTPDYGTNGYMKGNLFKITLGSYLQNQPCIIESFKFENIIADDITWQLNEEFALPYLFNINMSFKPIYNSLPSINNPTFINSDVIDDIGAEIDFFNSL